MFKKSLILLTALSLASISHSAPFLTCDPQVGVATYQVTGASWAPTSTIAQPDTTLKLDLAPAIVGTVTLQVKACNEWGECSTASPFVLTRPVAPLKPAGIRLIQ